MSTTQDTPISKEANNKESLFETAIDNYIDQINSLMDTTPLIIRVLASNTILQIDKFKDFTKKHNINSLKDEDIIKFSVEFFGCYKQLTSNASKAFDIMRLYPCNLVVSFVSMYDAYLGNIIKAIYKTTPEQLKDCNREFSINEILQFSSIEEAKERVIEKEAENVLRSSHKEQFEWFERKLSCPFKKFDSYNEFIEITERRNLFVHTNGVVSRQYLSVCSENKVKNISEIKVGDILSVTPDYLIRCYEVLFEVGVKLGIVVWRKLIKDNKKADYYLNNICYSLLKQGKYELAKTMLNFATNEIKKPASDEIRRYFIINKALAYYLSGDKKTCISIIDKEDWSATAAVFQLAIAVLKEDYKTAADKMYAAKDVVDNMAYCEWPLFYKFRNSDEFEIEYQKIFEQNFEIKTPQKENFDEVLQYALDIEQKVKDFVAQDTNTEECKDSSTTEYVND